MWTSRHTCSTCATASFSKADWCHRTQANQGAGRSFGGASGVCRLPSLFVRQQRHPGQPGHRRAHLPGLAAGGRGQTAHRLPLSTRLHDLRHTMATHCWVNAYRTGADVQALLVNLSVYLGHVSLSGTKSI